MDEKKMTLCIVAGVFFLAVLYIASEETGHQPHGKEISSAESPAIATAYLGLDFGAPFAVTGMLDMSPHIHGWHPGYDPVPGAQESIKPRHRYPIHCGGNVTATMVRGMNPLTFPNPGSNWMTSPPSEVDL